MNQPGHRIKLTILGLALLPLVLAAQLAPVWAGGPIFLDSAGVPLAWGGNPPAAPITPDGGGVGPVSSADALNLILTAAGRWQAISSSSITLPNAGFVKLTTPGPEGPSDFALNNMNEWFQVNDGISPVAFDNEDADGNGNGDIFDALGLPAGVLGFASPQFTAGSRITEARLLLNGPTFDTEDLAKASLTHELGHFLNFAHTVVNGQAFGFGGSDAVFPDGTPLTPGSGDVETMFPLLISLQMDTPEQDDMAIASTIYPNPNDPLSSFGAISGTLFDTDGESPQTGGQIIARNMAGNPLKDAVSAISGNFGVTGAYEINTLTPGGQYSLELRDTVTGGFSTPLLVPPGGGAVPTSGVLLSPEEFYSGPDEAASNPPDDPKAGPFLISVAAGGPHSGSQADLTLNQSIMVLVFQDSTDGHDLRINLNTGDYALRLADGRQFMDRVTTSTRSARLNISSLDSDPNNLRGTIDLIGFSGRLRFTVPRDGGESISINVDNIIVLTEPVLVLQDDEDGNCVRIDLTTEEYTFRLADGTQLTNTTTINPSFTASTININSVDSDPNNLRVTVFLERRSGRVRFTVPRVGGQTTLFTDQNIDDNDPCP